MLKARLLLLVILLGLTAQADADKPIQIAHSSEQKRRIIWMIKRVAHEYRIDHHLIQAVVQVESNYNPRAVSSSGAKGLMQLMPETQRDLGVRNAFDPWDNLRGGTRYLRHQIQHFGSVRKALWAYHCGPSRVKARTVPHQSRHYADRVIRIYWTLKKQERRNG